MPDMNRGNRASKRVAGVEVFPPLVPPPPAHDAFCQHFFRCLFCRIGDRYTDDHFCESGRDLLVAMLDEKWEDIPRVTPEEKRMAVGVANIISATGRVFTVPEWRHATRGFCE